jgi:protease PrsW
MEVLFSLVPVLLFLYCLYLMDSFKLVVKSLLILSLAGGMAAAGLAWVLNSYAILHLEVSFDFFSRYLAPALEELVKALVILALVSAKRIGFAIDAAVYGFAAGTGFALIENITYLISLDDSTGMAIWILRGFGTALMHGGATAILAVILLNGIHRDQHPLLALIFGLLTVIVIHSLHNHFFLNPFLQTLVIFIVLPVLFILVFKQGTVRLRNWLEIEFSNEIELLSMINQGRFTNTKAGSYLISLKNFFPAETILDLYCYISLYLELSINAKRNMMLKECGFPIPEDSGLSGKLTELKSLRKQIGKTGELALQPLIRMKYKELWKINQLKK